MSLQPRQFLLDLYHSAVAAVSADKCLPGFLPAPPKGRTLVIGAGKGAAAAGEQKVGIHGGGAWRGAGEVV